MSSWVEWRALGEQLRTAREQVYFSQQRVADLVGTTQSNLWNYEHGLQRPQRARLAKLAAVLDLDLAELLVLARYEPPAKTPE
jgi:transcriptional regulator with XRE-family HTH domain